MRHLIVVVLIALFIPLVSQGQSFQKQIIATDRSISDVFMVNSSVGYAGGVDGIYKTVNGGANWALLPFFEVTGDFGRDYYTANFNMIHLHFFNELEGFAYGWHSFNVEIIMRTMDGGVTWTLEYFENPSPPFTSDFNLLNAISVLDNQHMIIAGNTSRIIRTSDGGDNWVSSKVSDEKYELRNIQYVSSSKIYTSGGNQFFTSLDGGDHWSARKLNFRITDFHFFDELEGIAVDEQGFFNETSDGGVTWKRGFMQSFEGLNRLTFADSQNGYVTGTYGSIFKTTDGGKSWLKVYADGNDISSASLLDANRIWFSVQKGYLLHSTNGGSVTLQAPTLTSVDPASGVISQFITIEGANLANVLSVKFNGVPANFAMYGTSIHAEIPRGSTTGKIELVWPNGSVFSASDYVISKEPLLYFSTYYDGLTRGTTVTVQGENLQNVNRMTLRGVDFDFTVSESTAISFDLPADYPVYSEVDMTVYSPFGSGTVRVRILARPVIANFGEYDFDFAGPGKTITVNGSDLLLTSKVTFGDIPAAAFEVLDNNRMTIKVPEVSDKIVAPIYVTTPAGTSASREFKIYPAPVITSITPTVVKVGEEIKIEGKFLPEKWTPWIVKIDWADISQVNVRHIDEQTIYVKMPNIASGENVPVTITNKGQVKTTVNVPFTITGRLPNSIDYVHPIQTTGSPGVTIRGVFPYVDSLTIGGVKQTFNQLAENYIIVTPTVNTGSGVITLYDDGVPFSYSEELVITDTPSPTISDFSPKVAAPGSVVTITGAMNIRYINSIKVNGRSVPFEPSSIPGQNNNVSFKVTDSLTSGFITVTTIDGVYTTEDILTIKPVTEIKPVISSYTYLDPSGNDYILKLFGNGFLNTTKVRFDDYQTDFTIVDNDTLLVKKPPYLSQLYLSTNKLILESPAGQTELWFSTSSYPGQIIVKAEPAKAKQGAYIKLTLSKKKPYISYPDYYNFFFGSTISYKSIRLSDTTYLVQVPREGNIEGKLGITGSGFIFYSDIDFTLDKDEYCSAIGAGQTIFPLKKIMIQGKRMNTSSDGYVDNTGSPIDVIPGQVFRIGVTPSQLGVTPKIFIDWNGDREFNEPGILMVSGNALSPQDTMIYANLTVPPTAIAGTSIRLRIVSTLYGSPDEDLLACGIIELGQIIDYTLNIKSPSSILSISDFYPSIGTAGTKVTVIGDNLDALESVTLNGLPLDFNWFTETNAEVTIPEGAATGELVFNSATQTVTPSRSFIIDNTIEPPFASPITNNFRDIYRVTIDDIDVPFFYLFNPGGPYNQFYTVQENPESGILCVYTPGGKFCYDERFTAPATYNFPEPFEVKANEKVTITGTNLDNVTKITLDGFEDIPFTLIDRYSLTFIVPESASTVRELYITDPTYATSIRKIYYVTDEVPCDQFGGLQDGADIISVKFNQIANVSAQNTTGGISDYSDQRAIVDRYNSYYTDVVVKNFSNERRFVAVKVEINGTNTLTTYLNHVVGESDGIMLEPNQEVTLHPYFHIPNDITLGQNVGCWFVLTYFAEDEPCESFIGEVEQYSIFTKENISNSDLQISSMSTTVTLVNEEVVITGIGLDQVESVQIGDLYIPFTIDEPSIGPSGFGDVETSIRFTVPSNATSGKITVTTLSGDAQSPSTLQIVHPHAVTSIDPPFGKTGDRILLHGTNLNSVTTISFDGVAANDFLLFSSNTISVVVPPSAKTGPIRLKNEFDQQANSETFFYCDGQTPNQFCKSGQAITFAELPPATYGQLPFNLTAIASSALSVSYTSSNTSVATVSGNTVTIVGPGVTTITAKQAGNTTYYPAIEIERLLTVNKASQQITFAELQAVKFGQPNFLLNGTASSSLAVSYLSSDNSVATVSGNTVTIVGTGSAVLTAYQTGNNFYEPAISVDRTLVVDKASQTITFTPVADVLLSDLPVALQATSTSGLTIAFTSDETVTINNNILTAQNPGRISVRASQNGDANYVVASPVDREFCIIPLKPVITQNEVSPAELILTSSSVTGNHWFRNDVEIDGENQQTLSVSRSGTYKVRVTADDCVSEFSSNVPLVITGIEEKNENFSIYPNPVSDKMLIRSLDKLTEIRIKSITGSHLKTIPVTSFDKEMEIDLRDLKSGVYILELKQNNKLYWRRKFIKE